MIKVRKKRVCPSGGMRLRKAVKMFRSLKMPGKFVCLTCAIKEREEIRNRLRKDSSG